MKYTAIPTDFPVQPITDDVPAKDRATCGHCGLSWDDSIPTELTPAPSARCPFEYHHVYDYVSKTEYAYRTLLTYQHYTDNEDMESSFIDLLADMRLLAKEYAIDFTRALRCSELEQGMNNQEKIKLFLYYVNSSRETAHTAEHYGISHKAGLRLIAEGRILHEASVRAYENRCRVYEAEGMTRSDAQGCVDAELMQER